MPDQESNNPYQSPLATDPLPQTAQRFGVSAASLSRVALGLRIVYVGTIVTLLAVIWGVVGLLAVHDEDATELLAVGLIAIAGAGALLNIVGSSLCLATPEETGTRGMIRYSVTAMFVALAINILDWTGVGPEYLTKMQSFWQLAAAVTFVRFLGLLGDFMGRRDLVRRARSILIWGGILLVLIIPTAIIAGVALGLLAFILAAIEGVGWLAVFVMYINLISATRKAILRGGKSD